MKKPGRPRTYLPAEAAQAIYLAGAGESASNIADLIGNATAARVGRSCPITASRCCIAAPGRRLW